MIVKNYLGDEYNVPDLILIYFRFDTLELRLGFLEVEIYDGIWGMYKVKKEK
jgi:hypothetical protein